VFGNQGSRSVDYRVSRWNFREIGSVNDLTSKIRHGLPKHGVRNYTGVLLADKDGDDFNRAEGEAHQIITGNSPEDVIHDERPLLHDVTLC
jgi:hypothetical protein